MPRQPAQYHASSYGHEGDGGDVSPIVADLRPIPLMPRQPTISRIIVRARGGWGRRLAHRRRSASHPPHAPTTGSDHASSYGHEGDGGDVSPIVADLRPIPLMPRQPTTSRIIVRARGGWGRRLAHRRRSPSHPPHAPTTDNITHHRTGTRGMGATSRPSSQISVPSPSCPDNRPNITHHRTGTRGMGATSRPSSQISVPSPSCPDNRPTITEKCPSRRIQIGGCMRPPSLRDVDPKQRLLSIHRQDK